MPALPGHRDLEHGQGSQSHAPEVLQAGRIGEEFAGFAFLLKVQRRSRLDDLERDGRHLADARHGARRKARPESPAGRRSGGSAASPVASRRSAGSPESAAAPRSRSRRSLPGPTSGSGRGASAGVRRACSPPRAARAPRRPVGRQAAQGVGRLRGSALWSVAAAQEGVTQACGVIGWEGASRDSCRFPPRYRAT